MVSRVRTVGVMKVSRASLCLCPPLTSHSQKASSASHSASCPLSSSLRVPAASRSRGRLGEVVHVPRPAVARDGGRQPVRHAPKRRRHEGLDGEVDVGVRPLAPRRKPTCFVLAYFFSCFFE